MKQRYKIAISTMILILFIFKICIFATSDLTMIVNGEQDILAIGQVKNKLGNRYRIEFSEVLAQGSSYQTELVPKNIEINLEGDRYKSIVKDDYILCSINADLENNKYIVKNGIYRVSTGDTDTLEILKLDASDTTEELASLEIYLRSRGKYCNFYMKDDGLYAAMLGAQNSEDAIKIYDTNSNQKIDYTIENKYDKSLPGEDMRSASWR